MRRSLPLLITLSLLIGLIATVSTSHVVGAKGGQQVQNCGFSVDSQTGQRITLKECLLNTYGWPLKYSTSGVEAILRDYHTIVPSNPANASSIIGYTSFSRLQFLADWAIWSAGAALLVGSLGLLLDSRQPKKRTSNKK